MEMREGKLVTTVRLEGRRFTVFEDALIDTGASFTVVPPAIADFLELETYRESPRIPLTTASGLIEAPVRVLEAIKVGTQTVEGLPVVVHRIPDPAPVKVLIGMNFIHRAKLEVNGKAQTFEIEDP